MYWNVMNLIVKLIAQPILTLPSIQGALASATSSSSRLCAHIPIRDRRSSNAQGNLPFKVEPLRCIRFGKRGTSKHASIDYDKRLLQQLLPLADIRQKESWLNLSTRTPSSLWTVERVSRSQALFSYKPPRPTAQQFAALAIPIRGLVVLHLADFRSILYPTTQPSISSKRPTYQYFIALIPYTHVWSHQTFIFVNHSARRYAD
jgi:hypothetical protein